jgi:hypothetical protein
MLRVAVRSEYNFRYSVVSKHFYYPDFANEPHKLSICFCKSASTPVLCSSWGINVTFKKYETSSA